MRVLENSADPIVAIDAGTAVTRLCSSRSSVIERRSVIEEEIEGEPHGRATMSRGVIADIAGEAAVIEPMLRLSCRNLFDRPNAVVCTPTDATPGERESLLEAVAEAGANVVAVIPEPLAAAVGLGLDVNSAHAAMLVDIGDGVTDIAVIREAEIISSSALRIGCSDFRRSVQQWLEWHYGLPLSSDAAEGIVRAYFVDRAETIPVTHGSRTVLLSSDAVATVLDPVAEAIADYIETSFRRLSAATAAEVIERGIHVTGGGSRLRHLVANIDRRLPARMLRAADPLNSVIHGARAMMKGKLAKAR
jgi:rod shape-determining protein MreB